MAKFQVEQKVSVWYYTEVEAETWEQAVALADEKDDWQQGYEIDWQNEHWVSNIDTAQVWHGNGYNKDSMIESEL